MHLRDMRTLSGLQNGAPPEDEIRRMPDRVLRAAVQNPDHSEAARAAAEAELRARSISAERWRLVVPGFVRPADLERRGEKLFLGWGRAVRVWSMRAAIAVTIAASVANPLTGYQAAIPLGGAAMALLAIWFVASSFRRYPARVTLLRKFGERHLTSPLNALRGKELEVYGHIVELSDRLMPATRFNRAVSGHGVVLNARDYRNLALRLRNKFALNLRCAFFAGRAIDVRCAAAWWPITAHLLADSSDAIVVDLSQVDRGVAWELDMISAAGFAHRCVFIALWGKLEEAEAALAARGIDAVVHHYAPDGEMQRRAPFRAAVLAAMRATHHVAP